MGDPQLELRTDSYYMYCSSYVGVSAQVQYQYYMVLVHPDSNHCKPSSVDHHKWNLRRQLGGIMKGLAVTNQHGGESKSIPTPSSSPDMKSLVETYTSCIQQYLAVHLLDNATFYAERLVATAKTNDSLYLLALCYYRQNQPQRAKFILQNHNCNDSPDLLYMLAMASHDLEDYSTAEEALLRQARRDFRMTESADINQFILTTSVSQSVGSIVLVPGTSCYVSLVLSIATDRKSVV